MRTGIEVLSFYRPHQAVETRDRAAALLQFAQDFVDARLAAVEQGYAAADHLLGGVARATASGPRRRTG